MLQTMPILKECPRTAATMTTEEFLSHKKLALVRLAAQTPVMGDMKKELVPKGYEVPVVYLHAGESDPTIDSVKDVVEGAIISVPKSEFEAAAREAIEAGIPRLWLQAGCDSKEALGLCEEKGVPVIHGACVLMYAQPVQSVHRFHRGIWKVFGLLQD
jgi:predicted CoA-binding protein